MRLTIIVPEIRDKSLIKKLKRSYPKDEFIFFKQHSFDIVKKINHFIDNSKWEDIVIVAIRDKTILNSLKDVFRKDGTYFNNTDNFNNVYWNTSIKFNKNNIILPKETYNIKNSIEFSKWTIDNNGFDAEKNIQIKTIIKNENVNVLPDMKIDETEIDETEIDETEIDETETPKTKSELKLEAELKRKTREEVYNPKLKTITDVYNPQMKTTKPKILLVCDVKGWAWWNKSLYLKKYLSDDFHFDIIDIDTSNYKINPKIYDVCFTYGFAYIDRILKAPFEKRVTGITAHRKLSMLKPKMKLAKTIHANSEMLVKEAKKLHNNVFYVPNGVDEELFYPDPEKTWDEEITIAGHVGKLCKGKNQKSIIEPAVKKAGVKYIPHYNTYINRVELEKMRFLYYKMNVFIVASSHDGTPNPALEAMACGIPVISNKMGNMPEAIENFKNGILLNDLGVSSYVKTLKNYSVDNWKEMGYNARKTIEEGWTWKIQAERYRKLFWSVINGS